jgi:hypothetical protein
MEVEEKEKASWYRHSFSLLPGCHEIRTSPITHSHHHYVLPKQPWAELWTKISPSSLKLFMSGILSWWWKALLSQKSNSHLILNVPNNPIHFLNIHSPHTSSNHNLPCFNKQFFNCSGHKTCHYPYSSLSHLTCNLSAIPVDSPFKIYLSFRHFLSHHPHHQLGQVVISTYWIIV